MDAFLGPAYFVLGRLRNEAKFGFMAAVFGVPVYILTWLDRTPAGYQLAAVSLLIAAYFSVAFYAQAMKNWNELFPLLDRLAAGDLTGVFGDTADRVGQFAEIKGLVSDVNVHFGDIVAQARSGALRISVAAREIAAGNVNLSQRTEEQASTLEETASGMEELAATVKANAENCSSAQALADRADGVAVKGGEMVHKVIETMSGIEESSKKVSDIIGVIEGIAFRTNILALNAAVEAARAGEQGRGFAVVASEVRSLAHRSAAAAKEIKVLIGESVASVEQGGILVNETGRIITDVVASVKEVTHLIGEIAVASNQQSAGVEEINRAVVQMESVTQQNAALVDGATAAAVALEQESVQLAHAVSRFKLPAQRAEYGAPQTIEHAQASLSLRSGGGETRSLASPTSGN